MADYQAFIRDQQVQGMINSGKYDSIPPVFDGQRITSSRVTWCNVFTDDVAKRYNIKLPRMTDVEDFERRSSFDSSLAQHKDNPAYVKDMHRLLLGAVRDGVPGISSVSKDEGKRLADAGEYVMAIDEGHTTVMAPNIGSKWPVVYRSDQEGRTSRKLKIGFNSSAQAELGRMDLLHIKAGFDYSKIKELPF